jgi:hypothetical protein
MNKRNVVTAISSLTLLTAVGSAHAAGCLKGEVAGHVAGHHAVIGAVGECIVGHQYAKEKEKERAVAASQRSAVAPS